jgi:hypothetical protein
MAKKRKPLAERVRWKDEGACIYSCSLGGVRVVVFDWPAKKKAVWWGLSRGNNRDRRLKSRTLTAAKAEALRIVQVDVLRRAEEWRE